MFSQLNFLLVDDDPTTLDSLRSLLTRLGAESITVAYTADEAYQLALKARNRFDCLIADVRMPGGSGLELLHRIRTATTARGFRPDMCVVLMSGVASADVAKLARTLDVSAFLVKPFSVHSLQMAVSSARRRTFPLDQRRYARIESAALQLA